MERGTPRFPPRMYREGKEYEIPVQPKMRERGIHLHEGSVISEKICHQKQEKKDNSERTGGGAVSRSIIRKLKASTRF